MQNFSCIFYPPQFHEKCLETLWKIKRILKNFSAIADKGDTSGSKGIKVVKTKGKKESECATELPIFDKTL